MVAIPAQPAQSFSARGDATFIRLPGAVRAQSNAYISIANIVSFDGTNTGQPSPSSDSCFLGSDGNFYGTTTFGGTGYTGANGTGYGTVYEVTPGGTLTVLHNFTSSAWEPTGLAQAQYGANGLSLFGTLGHSDVQDSYYTIYSGTFAYWGPLWGYWLEGTTAVEGYVANPYNFGLTSDGSIYAEATDEITGKKCIFEGGFNGYGVPFEPTNLPSMQQIVQGSDGNFYATCASLGYPGPGDGLYQIIPEGGGNLSYNFSTVNQIANFYAPGYSRCSLIAGSDGNIYGVCMYNGLYTYGFVFKYTPGGTYQQIATFNGANGDEPYSIAQGPDGTLYGTTVGVGYDNNEYPPPYFFTITPDGTFISFAIPGGDFADIALFEGPDGNLYGFDEGSGAYGHGALFKINILPPSIQTQPANLTVLAGSSAAFTVSAYGAAKLNYQWQLNGSNAPAATFATYSIPNTFTNDAGSYSVIVSTSYGSVTSAVATLVVVLPPQNLRASLVGGTGVKLQFGGTPNFPYILQSATNLVSPVNWQPVSTNLAGLNGNWSYTNTPASKYKSLFFRAIALQSALSGF